MLATNTNNYSKLLQLHSRQALDVEVIFSSFNFRAFNFRDHTRPWKYFTLNIYSGKICAREKYSNYGNGWVDKSIADFTSNPITYGFTTVCVMFTFTWHYYSTVDPWHDFTIVCVLFVLSCWLYWFVPLQPYKSKALHWWLHYINMDISTRVVPVILQNYYWKDYLIATTNSSQYRLKGVHSTSYSVHYFSRFTISFCHKQLILPSAKQWRLQDYS